jgi:hypothetical protein
MDYKQKYLKYKMKYLQIKNLVGGAAPNPNLTCILASDYETKTVNRQILYHKGYPRKTEDEFKNDLEFVKEKIEITQGEYNRYSLSRQFFYKEPLQQPQIQQPQRNFSSPYAAMGAVASRKYQVKEELLDIRYNEQLLSSISIKAYAQLPDDQKIMFNSDIIMYCMKTTNEIQDLINFITSLDPEKEISRDEHNTLSSDKKLLFYISNVDFIQAIQGNELKAKLKPRVDLANILRSIEDFQSKILRIKQQQSNAGGGGAAK